MFLTLEKVENGRSTFGCINPDQVHGAYANDKGEIVLQMASGEDVAFPRTAHNLEQARNITGPVQFDKVFPQPAPLAGQVPLTPSGTPAQPTVQHDPHPDQNAFHQASRSPSSAGHAPDDIDPADHARFTGVTASERGVSADVRTTPLTNAQKQEAAERQRQEAAQREREAQKAKAAQAKGAQEKGQAQAGQTAQAGQKKAADQGQGQDQGKAGQGQTSEEARRREWQENQRRQREEQEAAQRQRQEAAQGQAHPGETEGERKQREFEEGNRAAEERRRQAASERKHE